MSMEFQLSMKNEEVKKMLQDAYDEYHFQNQPERSKREDLTAIAELPSDLRKRLECDLLDINR